MHRGYTDLDTIQSVVVPKNFKVNMVISKHPQKIRSNKKTNLRRIPLGKGWYRLK